MNFRYARHTDNLDPLVAFYTGVLGMEILGRFENHADYSGVFLGFRDREWHLEFTTSAAKAHHRADADDLLVFYRYSSEELDAIVKDAAAAGLHPVVSKNPYWQANGLEIRDPDGFGVVLTVQQKALVGADPLTQLVKQQGVSSWSELLRSVKYLPYGRNASRTNFAEVITEGKGSCSTKHALLKQLADANGVLGVQLMLGLYKMTAANTPNIGPHIANSGLPYLPEAHCYLKINGKRIDLTSPDADIRRIQSDLLEEIEITPEQVGAYKVAYHQHYLKRWITDAGLEIDFDEIWKIRERCIEALGASAASS